MKLKIVRNVLAILAAVAASLASGAELRAGDVTVLKAGTLYRGDGTALEGGMVVVRNGKIDAVGVDLAVPEGARVFEIPQGCITPGLVDADSTVGVAEPASWSEHASEVIPQLRTLDAVDLDDHGFDRLARIGVTTVYIGGGPGSVLTSRGTVVKTGGGSPGERILREAAQVKLTIGSEPYSRGTSNRQPYGGRADFLTRRPITRMGVAFVFRKAMYDTARAMESPDAPAPAPDPATPELIRVLQGKEPLRVQARSLADILTAFRLTREFRIRRFILEEGIEAARCIDVIREAGIPVIFGPLEDPPTGARASEVEQPNLSTPRLLHEAGVPLALTAGDLAGESALPGQAFLAVRYGLPVGAALVATTRTPAELLGVSERVGSLVPGRDGDVVLWSGGLFQPTTRAAVVLINGKVVLDATGEATERESPPSRGGDDKTMRSEND